MRTLLANPIDTIQKNCNFLLAFEEELLKVFVDGTSCIIVYQTVIKYAENEKPYLVPNLGFATGT
jgi:nucleosome binding factor SPN SPT16 subunit